MTPADKKKDDLATTVGKAEVGTTPPDTRAAVGATKDATRDSSATPAPTGEKADAAAAVKPGEATTPAAAAAQATTETALEAAGQHTQGERSPLGVEIPVIDVRHGMFGVHGSGDTSGYGGLVAAVALPGPSERPYGGWFDEVVDVLAEVLDESGTGFATAVESVVVDRGELTLNVARAHLVQVAQALRDDQDLRFELSLGVNGAHYPQEEGRELHAVYHLVSVTHGRRIRLEVTAPEADPHIPSTVAVYPANDWHERETWDFFGIVFDGHPGLARIEMPDDWPGHPQRKDYPLGGIPVEYKGASVPPPDERRSYN